MASALSRPEGARCRKRTRTSYAASSLEDSRANKGTDKILRIINPPRFKERITTNTIVDERVAPLYAENVSAKIWGIACRALNKKEPPLSYPEYTQPNGTAYIYTGHDFWTSGFFPGSLYLLLERQRKYPQYISPAQPHHIQLQFACNWWTANLHAGALKRDTHDLGFMIQPWARKAWELNQDHQAFDTLASAARSLSSRFDERVQSLRSWDTCVTKRYDFQDPSKDFLVIIDNMLNLDLLFWVSSQISDPSLRRMATAHARTTQSHHIRPDRSTFHVVNFEQSDGSVKAKFTNQGYSDNSCWARGQAWGILGFAQTFFWTKDASFLESASGLADYFLEHLPEDGVPFFDFLAPDLASGETPRDTSAALIAVYGMLLIHEAKATSGESSPYLRGALHILRSVFAMSLAPEAKFVSRKDGELSVDMGEGEETILRNATINNFEFAPRKWADHGLVYADYYFLLVGNKLAEMGEVVLAPERHSRED